MVNLSEFAERLSELISENKTTSIELAKAVGFDETSVYNYLNQKSIPSIETALKMCDTFNCTLEYLFARTDRKDNYTISKVPIFKERLTFLFKYFSSNEYQLTKATKISRSCTHAWLIGKSAPSIDNVAKIADYYGTTIDFVIGREN